MPTTTRKTTTADVEPAAVVVDHKVADASVGDTVPAVPAVDPAPAGAVVVTAAEVDPADPVVPGSELVDPDPRSAALAALLTQAPPVLSDAGPRPAPPTLPRLTGGKYAWHTDGDWYLVRCAVYARMIEDDRQQLRAGDLVQVRDDDRTQSDIAYGYLVPADQVV